MSPSPEDCKKPYVNVLTKTWLRACGISWFIFITYQVGIGCDRYLSKQPLCPYNNNFDDWYWYTCYAVLEGFLFIWSMLLFKILQMKPDNKRIPLWVAFNIVSMGTLATFLAVVWDWGGVCVDVLNVASPATIWGEWMGSGPLLIYITITISKMPHLSRMDYFLMISFFICLLTGFLIIIPQPIALGQFWLAMSCLFYIPLLILPWYRWKYEPFIMDESMGVDWRLKGFTERSEIRLKLSIWLTIIMPLYTVTYLVAMWGGIDYAMTNALYQLLSVVTKGLFAAVTMDIHLFTLVSAERMVVEERRANEARREFMKYIFHEVRTPLNSITMGIDLLEDGDGMGAKEKEYLGMMRSATVFMSDTLNDVLSLQKIEEGKLDLEVSPFDIKKSIAKVFNTMKGTAARKNIQLTDSFTYNTPYYIHADMHRIEHVISNLVSNAIKFSPENGIVLVNVAFEEKVVVPEQPAVRERKKRLSKMFSADSVGKSMVSLSRPQRSSMSRVDSKSQLLGNSKRELSVRRNVVKMMDMTVSVTDQGPGISAEDQAKLFNNFAQVRPGALQQGQGSGLGLSFVKKIIELHGGKVGVESEEGKGSTFKFTIPVPSQQYEEIIQDFLLMSDDVSQLQLVRPPENVACGLELSPARDERSSLVVSSPPPRSPVPMSPQATSPLKSESRTAPRTNADPVVLVVDDAEINRKMLCALLRKMQLPCEEASDGQIALDMVKQDIRKYSLVLMDNLMPNMDGVQATKAMREVGFPCIIAGVTGNVMVDDIKEYLDCGADIVYAKPLKLPTLKLLIEYIKREGPQSQPGKKLVEQGGELKWALNGH